ncbi:hypothetical protein O181_038120 [Austropuccinia psidii MF-1]|uniref:Reverse transcriptase domain-containing protein n=1 Tax=Austropuccinia psidii MF-1 TaxID=1389203 RepID=A0A9Q3D9B2_9BASI|nr:hypothetical protein [Austropuccinia psidii MF-1]
MLCGDFRALNNYTKAYRYPIPRIPHALDKLEKAKYITKIHCMKGFHQNGGKQNSMNLLTIICHMGIYEYTRRPFGIKNALAHFQRMMDTIFQEELLEGWMVVYIDDIIIYSETCEYHVQYIDRVLKLLELVHEVSGLSMAVDQNRVAEVLQKPVPKSIKEMQSLLGFASYYRNHIKTFAHITSSPYSLCSKHVVFEINKERRDAYERTKHELTNAPVLILPDFQLKFKFYIGAACSEGLGEALHQKQIVDDEPRKGVICNISRQLKNSEARYGETQTEFLFLVWALEHSIIIWRVQSLKHMLRWQLANQEDRGNMTIIYKEGKCHTNADGLSRWPLGNVKSSPAYDPEVAAKIPIHLMEIDRRKNLRFSE